jgi:hypothetical protein
MAHARPGNIVVIHDGHHRNPVADRLYAVAAVTLIVDGLRGLGYELAPLTEPAWHRPQASRTT